MSHTNGKAAPKRGRPTSSPTGERADQYFALRMTRAQRGKLESLGGAEWVRAQIDGAKLAKEKK